MIKVLRICSLLGLALALGCVERRMTVVSDPPGAVVSVNGKPVGAAPVDVPSNLFLYYGDYDLMLVRDGFEPLLVKQPVPAPWYEYFPLDFVSENLIPWHIKDTRVFSYQLSPAIKVPPDEVLDRAAAQREHVKMILPPAFPPPDAAPAPEELPPPARLENPVP
jgi:hypothetical protein